MADTVGYFPASLAVDIATRTPQRNAQARIYAMTDTSFASPLAITDMADVPYPDNVLTANGDGVYPEFKVPTGVTQVFAKSGQALTPLTSVTVYVEAAEKARAEARGAASDASAAAGDAVSAAGIAQKAATDALAVGVTSDAQMTSIQANPASTFAQAQKATFAPGGTAGNISKSTAQGVALVQALIFGGN